MSPFDESRLDDPERSASLDRLGMVRALAGAGAQVRSGVTAAQEAGIDRVAGGERPRSVLVAALGGTGIVADVLAALSGAGSPVPVAVRHEEPLPAWVGTMDLVVALSLSGTAPGPLALAAEARRRGAWLLTVGAADSPLAQVCARARGVHVPVDPAGRGSRTSFWSLAVPPLLALGRLGLLPADPQVLDAVADALDEQSRRYRPSSDAFVNPAKTLASDLAGSVPTVLGDGPVCGVVAARAAAMLGRTARLPATWGQLPAAAAQLLSCLDGPFGEPEGAPDGRAPADDIFADPFLDGPPSTRLSVLMLREAAGEAGGAAQMADRVVASARNAGLRVHEHTLDTGPPLVRLAGGIALVDFAAAYLAIGSGYDPSRSPHLADLRG